ncbi:MAG TPA: hypothetical protein P5081_23030 [Phycisphaerae bacterium]|nr:hypothetical protein [Phycisphaerae bacterium]HRW55757.1 hypothetical protein [Phycisphaerae bacterium]
MPSRHHDTRLRWISACIGLALFVISPATLRAEDCNGNGVEDAMDIDPTDPDGDGVVSADCNSNQTPDECELGTFETRLSASNLVEPARFGHSVSIRGAVAIVGSDLNGGSIANSGSAYVYRYAAGLWQEEAELTAAAPASNDRFGAAVAIDGDWAVVGADGGNDSGPNSGAALVFHRVNGTWQEVTTLIASNVTQDNSFGFSVSISGDTVIVGARTHDGAFPDSGAAYVFRYVGGVWVEEAELTASDAAAGDFFGVSVAVRGDVAIVGAPISDQVDVNCGAAYVYRRTNGVWTEEARLLASNAAMNDNFGASVSIYGDTAIIGAYHNDTAGQDAGAAYIFRRVNGVWQEETPLYASNASDADRFGSDVSIDDNLAIVGAYFSNSDGGFGDITGAAYVFRRRDGQWNEIRRLTASDDTRDDRLGASVAIHGRFAIVGAPGLSFDGPGGGKAYLFDVFARNCNGNAVPDDCELDPSDPDGDGVVADDCDQNLTPDDCDPDCNANGVPDVCDVDPTDPDGDGLISKDCNANGVPDTCEADCNANGVPDDCDIDPSDPDGNGEFSADCNNNSVPDTCELSGADCNANGVPDECDLDPADPDGDGLIYHDCNNNGVMEDCEPLLTDCNNNGIPDACDIDPSDPDGDGLVSDDCNNDGVPTECEGSLTDCNLNGVSDHCEFDCNDNGVPDDCDIDPSDPDGNGEISADCNGNQIPDECELGTFESRVFTQSETTPALFGLSAAISDESLIVGRGTAALGTVDTGAAYIYRKSNDTWLEEARLTASDAAAESLFGLSVDIDGDRAVVGAYGEDSGGHNAGAAYVFHRVNGVWLEETKLVSDDPNDIDLFAYAVAIRGDTIMIGATLDDDVALNGGAVYIYRLTGGVWRFQQKLFASDMTSNDEFGSSLSIDGDQVLIGARRKNAGASASGVVYVFRKTGLLWQEETRLTPSQAYSSGFFGESVSLSGDVAIVGAPGDGMAGNTRGAAYIFRRDAGVWDQETVFTAPNAGFADYVGWSVALDGDLAVVGARGDDDAGENAGAAYILREINGQWSQFRKLVASDTAEGDDFGGDVALEGRTVVSTASQHAGAGANTGSAYIFDLLGQDCNGNSIPDECDIDPLDPDGNGVVIADCNQNAIPDDCELDCNANGVPDDCDLDPSDPDGDGVIIADCNVNGIPDPCDSDCNLNGVPDDCDLSPSDPDGDGVVYDDCNANFVPDDCEADCNANGVPDDCDAAIGDEITLPDPLPGEMFGGHVSIDGDTIVVGHGQDGIEIAFRQFATAFRKSNDGWDNESTLRWSDDPGLEFGGEVHVSVSGDSILVSGRSDVPAGAVQVFRRVGEIWTLEASLTPSDGVSSTGFGASVALDGNLALIGADRDDEAGNNAGALYIFRRTGDAWQEETKLTVSNPSPSRLLGESVAIDGDTLVGGAWGDASFGGAAYVFRRVNGNWDPEATLIASDRANSDYFGVSVAIDGDTIVVGAPRDDDIANNSGSAYVFQRVAGAWQEVQKLSASAPASADLFGQSVTIDGEFVIVGSTRGAYLFRRVDGVWSEVKRLAFSNVTSVGLDNGVAVMGTPYETFVTFWEGAVQVLDITSRDCNLNSIPDECDLPGDMNADGVTDESDFADFIAALLAGASCPLADLNRDGVLNGLDIAEFIDVAFPSSDCNHNGVSDDNDAIGDVNGDGVLDIGDLPGFVALLLEGADCAPADVNQDGAVDGRDVAGFVALLLGA